MHQKYAESKLGQSSIEKFCIKGNDSEHETTNAELLWTNFITEHNSAPVPQACQNVPQIKVEESWRAGEGVGGSDDG